jgi:diguanylate cyclase (GGDEF)-like protein
MIMADIDDFKSLNDRLGHAAGDELLAGLARVMNEMVRDSDLLARYGGEEFVARRSASASPTPLSSSTTP